MAPGMYHRLILLVGSRGRGKTAVLRQLARRLSVPCLNVGTELSDRLLDMTDTQRTLAVCQALNDILSQVDGEVTVLDNIDILFAPALRQNGLQRLKLLSRTRTVVAAWHGQVSDGFITRGSSGHAEYVRERIDGFQVVEAGKIVVPRGE